MDLNFCESADFFGLNTNSEPNGGTSQPDFERRTFGAGELERGGVQNVPFEGKVRGLYGFIAAASDYCLGGGGRIPGTQIS